MKRKVDADDLVSCKNCGVVYDVMRAGKFIRCPTCETTANKTSPHPKLGRIHKWWSEVEA